MSIRRFWPPEVHHRVMVLLSAAAVGVVFAHLILPETLLERFRINIPLVTLVLLALFVLAYIGNEAEESGLRHAEELGLKEVFASRMEPGQSEEYSDLLKNAKSELFVVGVTLKDLTNDIGGLLLERASKGCRVELLMLSPEFKDNRDPIVDPLAFANGPTALKLKFSTAIGNVRRLAKSVRDFNREQEATNVATKRHGTGQPVLGGLSVRFYKTIPTVSMIVRDGKDSDARMHIEVIPHQATTSQFRPILDIEKRGMENGLFSKFYRQYRILWEKESIPYLEVSSTEIIVADEELDRKISRMLSLPNSWLQKASDHKSPGQTAPVG